MENVDHSQVIELTWSENNLDQKSGGTTNPTICHDNNYDFSGHHEYELEK